MENIYNLLDDIVIKDHMKTSFDIHVISTSSQKMYEVILCWA